MEYEKSIPAVQPATTLQEIKPIDTPDQAEPQQANIKEELTKPLEISKETEEFLSQVQAEPSKPSGAEPAQEPEPEQEG